MSQETKADGRTWAAVTADQRGSRKGVDRVPEALAALAGVSGVRLEFERTAGDEIQGLIGTAEGVVAAVEALARLDASAGRGGPGWKVGIGIGPVSEFASSTRASRGEAYLCARTAVEEAARTPLRLRLIAASGIEPSAADRAETALVLLRGLLLGRTRAGWEAVDLMAANQKQSEVADILNVSESAVSQRLDRAAWRDGRRAGELAAYLLTACGLRGAE